MSGFIFSLGIIILLGFIIGWILSKIKIPGLAGMILFGIIIGPYMLNLISKQMLDLSDQFRQIALVIILTRSGLNLDIKKLLKIGHSAILMCFLPASFEIAAITVIGHFLLGISFVESAMLGAVLSAVSPAVVSPRMINLINKNIGTDKQIPQVILAGASFDDIYVIVLFYSFLNIATSSSFSALSLLKIPTSLITGIVVGVVFGIFVGKLFVFLTKEKVLKVILIFGINVLFLYFEYLINQMNWNSFSYNALISVLVFNITIFIINKEKVKETSDTFNYLWIVFEIILFVLVGAKLQIKTLNSNILQMILTIFIGLFFRAIAVYLCFINTNLNIKERIFCVIAFMPKATVQASIGSVAQSKGVDPNGVILATSILSILITAPLFAFLIDFSSKRLLITPKNISKWNI
ncbi:sodium:proton antiporter [Mycoplasmopsis anatis]|uniref:Na(+)/h(+) antiporter n=1 Tax=Mycoplasmopsis anatis 1340 TaxID=1034808 RepID=F9QDF1_9BACT|nr:cation:proton antiporter [Mycoplasmopsis anatis]AWX70060.1 sodium:proton antiporter [Mycoplasmopsis anatis]EGS29238.1 na(+)/h(+) antiporter [Mycoplasmopsis anatis 1340]VEU73500.1 potassium/proton antiporter [Mycoplasmopsis anatis]